MFSHTSKLNSVGDWLVLLALAVMATPVVAAPEGAAVDYAVAPVPESSIEASPRAQSRLAPDRLAIAAGLGLAPDYEGSNNYILAPAAGLLARVKGHSISWRGNSLSVDLVPEYRDKNFKFIVAPFVSLDLDRATTPKDAVVKLIRKRKIALEAGGVVGLTASDVLTSKYDSLTLRLAASYDVGNVHKSFIITPTAEYLMPVSKGAMLATSLSADFVGGRYARYYYGVGSIASGVTGLPVFRPGGGLKSISAGLGGVISLRGDLQKGFVVGALLNYERLIGDFAASPLVKTRGNPNQLLGTLGIGYVF